MMRAIKIDPSNRTIEEIQLTIDPNRSLSELRSIIGAEELELIPLDKGFNLLADLHGEQKPCFGFCELDEPVIHGVAVVLGGSPRRLWYSFCFICLFLRLHSLPMESRGIPLSGIPRGRLY